MGVVATTKTEMTDMFYENIKDLIEPEDVKEYVVSMLVDIAYNPDLPIRHETPDTVIISKHFENNDFFELMKRGDSYLFLLGWFPKYTTRRQSPGKEFYFNWGISSYNFALSLIHQNRLEHDPKLVSKLANSFYNNTQAVYSLKKRLSGNEIVLSLEKRMEESNMRIIK
ncbi:hypothetical protein GOV08_03225 [Candidatus Woesearchaeota archaeon]|nr:hypothetical protein [Candidatus Woesearchaeota archaeon]